MKNTYNQTRALEYLLGKMKEDQTRDESAKRDENTSDEERFALNAVIKARKKYMKTIADILNGNYDEVFKP